MRDRFEELILSEFGETYNLNRSSEDRYKYHDIQTRWVDFKEGFYPYKELTAEQLDLINELRKLESQHMALAHGYSKRIQLIRRGRA